VAEGPAPVPFSFSSDELEEAVESRRGLDEEAGFFCWSAAFSGEAAWMVIMGERIGEPLKEAWVAGEEDEEVRRGMPGRGAPAWLECRLPKLAKEDIPSGDLF
jgi:hypothetical protein